MANNILLAFMLHLLPKICHTIQKMFYGVVTLGGWVKFTHYHLEQFHFFSFFASIF